MLDLYCYVGSWSLFSVLYGANSSVGYISQGKFLLIPVRVDTSEVAIKLANENAALNNMTNKVKFIKAEAESVIDGYLNKGANFDVIVLDPPGLVHAKGK